MTITKRAKMAALGGISLSFIFQLPPAFAQEDVIKGIFALPDGKQTVAGEMTLDHTGPLSREMKLIYKDQTTGEQITDFEVELTQELHILATDKSLSTLVHQHVEQAGNDGVFSTIFEFPAAGLYHVYTDAVPSGDYGQQVLRFDVSVGDAAATPPTVTDTEASPERAHVLESSNGDYTVKLDVAGLKAKQESAVQILIEKDGKPARDLTPYLGVAAHAVFVRASDLAYVHAHASGERALREENSSHEGPDHQETVATDADNHALPSEQAAETESHGSHNGHAMPDQSLAEGHGPSVHGADHSGHGTLASSMPISAEMDLLVTPPAPGRYALWIEFMAGGAVQTIPFQLEIPPHS
jgi:hypothetical protein